MINQFIQNELSKLGLTINKQTNNSNLNLDFKRDPKIEHDLKSGFILGDEEKDM